MIAHWRSPAIFGCSVEMKTSKRDTNRQRVVTRRIWMYAVSKLQSFIGIRAWLVYCFYVPIDFIDHSDCVQYMNAVLTASLWIVGIAKGSQRESAPSEPTLHQSDMPTDTFLSHIPLPCV